MEMPVKHLATSPRLNRSEQTIIMIATFHFFIFTFGEKRKIKGRMSLLSVKSTNIPEVNFYCLHFKYQQYEWVRRRGFVPSTKFNDEKRNRNFCI